MISILYLNVGRFWLLELEVPVLVSRNAVPQPTTQGQAGKKSYIKIQNKEKDDLVSSSLMISMMSLHLLKVEASGGKEAPASLLLSLNGVGAGKGAAKLLNYFFSHHFGSICCQHLFKAVFIRNVTHWMAIPT